MVWKGVLESNEAIDGAFIFMGSKEPLMVDTCPPFEDIDAAICKSRSHCPFPNSYRVPGRRTHLEIID